ncbi:Arginine decarboxylase [Desulfotomaculum nigrificans CO-1-SRB]|uniref:Arginine decarboxylase n=1 Tax=Desulfotomaculum nigrificans (strain DSM 14880 / VKM B-2319 / CO-1-SRB) TaxID=868595 RepID=F6B3X9_DESCC|nr:aminotransferase class I/II-fold pyridoxal phosphate-dependent enzyme [Desulfotomaculum nigrificans]AEF92944.1 Arginine decarboxylase [Desulfotomaculum nigrificans CO-1-SRB]
MRQERAPLWEALIKHRLSQAAQLHVPGHRGGQGMAPEFLDLAGTGLCQIDLTEIPGLDDLHHPQGPIAEAQKLAAELYQADKSFFMVNGTSGGLMALILTCCGQGNKILVPRNAHRSVISGLILSGAMPVYYCPPGIKEFACLAGPDAGQIEQYLKQFPETRAVVCVHPTYYGVAGDIAAVAEVCHSRGIPLLVDEAHGAHLKFHPDLPPDALSCGADAVAQSTHKLGGSLTQSSLLHLKSNLINDDRLADALRMVQSTSPSYLLMASLDVARRQLARQGRELLDKAVSLARWCRQELARISGVRVLDQQYLGGSGAKYLDVTRLTVSLLEAGISGYRAAELLAQKYGVMVEMADYAGIVAIISIGTTRKDVERLVKAVKSIVTAETGSPLPLQPALNLPEPVVRLSPREAWFKEGKPVPLKQSLGKISAETVAVYPPGIPVLCPGEEITGPVLEYLAAVQQGGFHIQGPQDGTLSRIRVLD